MMVKAEVNVLFVCLGNICRSPTAEGVFRHWIDKAGLDLAVHVDSAGTGNYHIGCPPDSRAIQAAEKRNIDIRLLRARQVRASDFAEFDYIIAMDRQNHDDLMWLAPPDQRGRICLFLDFASRGQDREIPDPYYGGPMGFERVLDMIDDASKGLMTSKGTT